MPDQSFSDWWRLHKDELMQDENVGLREIAEEAWDECKKQADEHMRLFVDLSEQVRSAQNTYFRDRTSSNLIASKKLESRLDQAIVRYRQDKSTVKNTQLSFIEENNNGQSD